MKTWSNLAKVVYRRTYARSDNGPIENWEDTVNRVIMGNIRNHNVSDEEINQLRYLMLNRKATPAGRGLWFSGAPAHNKLGGVALNNCWGLTCDNIDNFVIAQDLLMLGGGVGMSVEHRFVSKLKKVKTGVNVVAKHTKDADFIIPDSREGWNELTRRILEAFFVAGKSFSYSTVCVRGSGEKIAGFGGIASGPLPLQEFASKLTQILQSRAGKHIRPIDAADILCSIGEMVVSGNVRRSAIIILGDPWDKEYLTAKRWDLGPIPTQRAKANFSVVCEDVQDLHPLFWETYENGEPFGIVNRKNMQKFGRMGEFKHDSAVVVNPCVPGDTEILTDKGYYKIKDLIGSTVNVWNGWEFSPVQPQITGKHQPMVKVILSSGQELTCTTKHRFLVQSGYRGEQQFVEADKLTKGQTLAKTNFPIINTGENIDSMTAYTQGFYSGDGDSSNSVISLYDTKYICEDRLKGIIGKECNRRKHVRLSFKPKPKEFVPFHWNVPSRINWLAGLIDSDGCELKEGGCQISSVNKQFLLDTQKMLTTLGVVSKVSKARDASHRLLPNGNGGKSLYQCQTIYRLLIGSIQIQDLKKLGLHCSRVKFVKNPSRDASQFIKIVEVIEMPVEETVYCFKEGKRGLGTFEGIVTGQCAEATLENAEPCNLQEIALPNLQNEEEFITAARLMHRWGKRVTCERYHQPLADEVVKRNRRIGTGITGCLESSLFNPTTLDRVYAAIQQENQAYSKELGIPESIRTTVVKPSGTMSKVMDCAGEGIHPAYSRYFIQRVRFSANDPLIPLLWAAGHPMEPVIKLDGSLDHNTLVVDFYQVTRPGVPIADEDWDTFKQLDALLMSQKHWADQAVSVTVYYSKDNLPELKTWLADNLKNLKTISFLCHNDHGFKQAPKEAITAEQYDKLSSTIKDLPLDLGNAVSDSITDLECDGACPTK